jgi:hypothetical protein
MMRRSPQGNYEVVSSRAAQGSGEKLVAAANTLLNDLYPPRQQAITPHEKITLFNGRDFEGWYTWLKQSRHQDPKEVFSVKDGAIRVSGEEWGGLATRQMYRDYHLIVEWKWGGPTHGDRTGKARDSGILVHALGEDGASASTWLESVESQVIEGGTGDFIMVGGRRQPSLTVQVREGARGELYWDRGEKP